MQFLNFGKCLDMDYVVLILALPLPECISKQKGKCFTNTICFTNTDLLIFSNYIVRI